MSNKYKNRIEELEKDKFTMTKEIGELKEKLAKKMVEI